MSKLLKTLTVALEAKHQDNMFNYDDFNKNIPPPTFTTWVDDVVFYINATTNEHLTDVMKDYTAIIHQHFHRHGLTVNFKPSKQPSAQPSIKTPFIGT